MHQIKFLLALLTTIGLIFVLDTSFMGETPTPALGKVINPFTGFWKNAEAIKIPENQQTYEEKVDIPAIHAAELKGDASVIYDERLVPHIFAEYTEDAMFIQGYVTAQHRLWQMDFSTRSVAGRLSEVMGKRLLKRDQDKRRKGMQFGAENAVKAWKKNAENYGLLEKYVAGVNAYIESLEPADYPIEFKLLNYAPEKWTVLKTALFNKSMAESLASRASDVSASNALEMWGEDSFDYIYETWFPEESPIIPSEVNWDYITKDWEGDSLSLGGVFPQTGSLPFEEVDPTLGSNNWAINGEKSSTGQPILCGDPHLRMTLPAVWFENQIQTPDYNVYGVSLPGLPGVTIGFNEHIAWSMTNVGHDVSDFYTITWQDSSKQAYLIDGEYEPVDKRIETYKIRGEADIIDTVRYTRWGPVYISTEDGKDLALRWLVHDDIDDDIVGVALGLNKAKNYEDYRAAIKSYGTPAQNIVFASRDGDIGITVQGMFAIKKKGQGRFVLDGSQSSNAWQGMIPREHVPAVKNPSRNFVASANQNSTMPDYPYPYHSEGFEAYRGRYLNQQLAAKNKFTMQDMMALQTSNYSLKAEEALPLLLKHLDKSTLSEQEKAIADTLASWNYRYERELLVPAYFEAWFTHFYKNTWDEVLDQKEYEYVLKPRHWKTIFMLRDSVDIAYFDKKDTPEKENGATIANLSFKEMLQEIDSLQNENPDFNWADYNEVRVMHLARLAPFSRTDIHTSGTRKALNAINGQHGPSWRMVVNLGERRVTAKVVYPAGQSGNPGSPYYDSFIDTWAEGRYYEAWFMNKADQHNRTVLYSQEFLKK